MLREFNHVQINDVFAAYQYIGLLAELGDDATAGSIPDPKLLVL